MRSLYRYKPRLVSLIHCPPIIIDHRGPGLDPCITDTQLDAHALCLSVLPRNCPTARETKAGMACRHTASFIGSSDTGSSLPEELSYELPPLTTQGST